MQFNSLKDKCEYYRGICDYKLLPNGYVLVMVDGHSFSKKIKKRFERPFDDVFINAMNETAKYVCDNVQGIQFAYVQSDEISFFIKDDPMQGAFFGLRMSKLLSLIASYATSRFNQIMTAHELSKDGNVSSEHLMSLPIYEFDCKVWNVPNMNDVFAWFLYRQIDCIRNSKQQTASTYISHSVLEHKTSDEQIKMVLDSQGVDWHSFDDGKKFGRLIVKQRVEKNGVLRTKWTITNAPLLTEKTSEYLDSLIVKRDGKENSN